MIIWDMNIDPEKYKEVMSKIDSCLIEVGICRENHASYCQQLKLEKKKKAHLHKWYILYWLWRAIDEGMASNNKEAIKKIYDVSNTINK